MRTRSRDSFSEQTLVGPGVEHTAHLLAWAVQLRLTATELLALPF